MAQLLDYKPQSAVLEVHAHSSATKLVAALLQQQGDPKSIIGMEAGKFYKTNFGVVIQKKHVEGTCIYAYMHILAIQTNLFFLFCMGFMSRRKSPRLVCAHEIRIIHTVVRTT